jgi:hypothetical protein
VDFDRLGVAGEDDSCQHLAGLSHRVGVGDQILGPLVGAVERAGQQQIGGDIGDQVVGGKSEIVDVLVSDNGDGSLRSSIEIP